MAQSGGQRPFWKKGTDRDRVPGSVKQVYGAQHPPLQHPVDQSTMDQLSKAGTPEKQKKMTFDLFAGKTADVWETDEGLSGLSLDSARDRQLSPTESDVATSEALTSKVKLDFDVSSHFVEKVRPRTSSTSAAEVKQQPAETRSRAQTQIKGKGSKKGILPTSKSKGTKQFDSQQRQTSQIGRLLDEDYFDIVDTESNRLERFGKLLAGPNTDLHLLKKLSWSGIPPAVRGTTWQLLLGYLPANIDRREETIARKRREYQNLISQYYQSRFDELHAGTYRQIHIDVPRMNPRVPLFQQQLCQDRFERILFIWAIRRPASGYVQGINDLVTPFFVVFLSYYIPGSVNPESLNLSTLKEPVLDNLEADSFWCMSLMLDRIQDNYTFAQPGIQRSIMQMEDLVKTIDLPLHKHLQSFHIEYLQFAFRWVNNLLMRELPLRLVVRLWDIYLSEGDEFPDFHIYVCVAMLLKFTKEIQSQEDFQGTMLLLQSLPTEKWTDDDIQILVAEAYKLKAIYGEARGHLKTP